MIVVNTDFITGHTLQTICMVSETECKTIIKPVWDSRSQDLATMKDAVMQKLISVAHHLNADGIINVKIEFSISGTFLCLIAVGTAVKFVD